MEEIKYSLQDCVIELIRRNLLTVNEGREVYNSGLITEEIMIKINKRIKENPAVDIPGIYKIEDFQKALAVKLSIMFLIDRAISN